MDSINSLFDTDEFKPLARAWQARLKELTRRRAYYDGSVYGKMKQQLGWLWPRLYKGIKPLYLGLARAVDVDAGIIPGGWALAEDAPDTWQPAIDTVFDWSDWARDGVLYIHYGAQYGVVGLKVSDLRDSRIVQIKPLKPTCFMLVEAGDYDTTASMAIYVERKADSGGAEYEYAEVIAAETVRTFRDGQPSAFGGREAAYKNELGFVPFVEAEHKRTGEAFGECTYQQAIPLLDEVNQLASYLADIIAKHAEPQWVVSGSEASDLVKSGDNVWYLPDANAKVTPLVAGVDIAGVLEFIREIRDQVHGALPELAFDELRKKDQIATATLELQLMELVLKIKRCRPNYDHGLADALRMAARAAASMSIGDIGILDDEALTFDAERPVLPLDPQTAMSLELQQIALDREKALDMGAGAARSGPQSLAGMNGREPAVEGANA
jgi:hypothetical protein